MVRTYKQKNKLCKNTKLSEKQTYSIVHSYVDLDSTSECSEKTSVSITTVKKHYAAIGERLHEILLNDEFPNYHFDNLVFKPLLAFILTPLSKGMADELVPCVSYEQFIIFKKAGRYEGLPLARTGKLEKNTYYKRAVFEQLAEISLKRKIITRKYFYRHLALARYRSLITSHILNCKFNESVHEVLAKDIIPDDFDISANANAARTGILLDSLIRRPLVL